MTFLETFEQLNNLYEAKNNTDGQISFDHLTGGLNVPEEKEESSILNKEDQLYKYLVFYVDTNDQAGETVEYARNASEAREKTEARSFCYKTTGADRVN